MKLQALCYVKAVENQAIEHLAAKDKRLSAHMSSRPLQTS